ncbi:hypothetical protein MMC32_001513 [Xylographa parallela]|nr:hypothetical protein [Xylographa parallela]
MTYSAIAFIQSRDNRGSRGQISLPYYDERPQNQGNCGFHHPYCPKFKYCKKHPDEYGINASQSGVSNEKSSNSRPDHTNPSANRQAQDGKMEYQCDPCKTEKDKIACAEFRERIEKMNADKKRKKRMDADRKGKEEMDADRDIDGDTLYEISFKNKRRANKTIDPISSPSFPADRIVLEWSEGG